MFIAQKLRFGRPSPFSPMAEAADFSADTIYEAAYSMRDISPTLVKHGGRMSIGGNDVGEYEFYRTGASLALSSWAPAFFHQTDKHNICSMVFIDGDFTINSGVTVSPGNRRHFACYYVAGDLILNGKLSMTGLGACHGLASRDNTRKTRWSNGGFANTLTPTNNPDYEHVVDGSGNFESVPKESRVPVAEEIRQPWAGSNTAAVNIPIKAGTHDFTMGTQPLPSAPYSGLDPTIAGNGGAGGAKTSVATNVTGTDWGKTGESFTAPTYLSGSSGTLAARTGGGGSGTAYNPYSVPDGYAALGGAGGAGTCFTGGTGGGSGRHNIFSLYGDNPSDPNYIRYENDESMRGAANGMAGGYGRNPNSDMRAMGVGSPTLQHYRYQSAPPYYSPECSLIPRGQGGVMVVFVEGTITGSGWMEAKGVDFTADERTQYQNDGLWGGLSGGASGGGIVMSFSTGITAVPHYADGGTSRTFPRRQIRGGHGGQGSAYRFSW